VIYFCDAFNCNLVSFSLFIATATSQLPHQYHLTIISFFHNRIGLCGMS
jgi:hypothetical protein